MIDLTLSVSQVTTFDAKQTGGCERKFWFERTAGLKPDQTTAQTDGESGHSLLEAYFLSGARPEKRVKMGKAVMGAIVKGDLPEPGPDLLVEQRFSGQARRGLDGSWVPLDREKALLIGGVPWDGFVDLAWRRGDIPDVLDHKFVGVKPEGLGLAALAAGQLINTIQLPVYVHFLKTKHWPDARAWRIGHHYVAKSGVASLIRRDTVSDDQVSERMADVVSIVERVKQVSALDRQDDIPANRKACEVLWPSGFTSACPHQSICRAFRERNKVILSTAELEMFGDTQIPDSAALPPPTEAPAPAEPPRRRAQIVDVPDPVPAAAPPPEPCACGVAITAENGSRLQSGVWKHVGCPLDAPAPAPAPAPEVGEKPKTKRAKKEPAAPASVPAPEVITAPAPEVITVGAPLPAPVVDAMEDFAARVIVARPSRAVYVADLLRAISDLIDAP